MNIPSIEANYRIGVGSASAERTRKVGYVPAVIYDEQLNKSVQIDKQNLDYLIKNYGDNTVVNVQVGDDVIKSMIMNVQRHPISNQVIHIDLKPVNQDTRVHTQVPIRFIGLEQVKRSGGILQKQRSQVEIECVADNVPKYLMVDLSNLSVGDSYTVQDMEFAEELTLITKTNEVIATLTSPAQDEEENNVVLHKEEENADNS